MRKRIYKYLVKLFVIRGNSSSITTVKLFVIRGKPSSITTVKLWVIRGKPSSITTALRRRLSNFMNLQQIKSF